MRYVTCKNHNNDYEITFRENSFDPFILANIEGIYQAKNKVSISENTMTDGGTYQGSNAEIRNIVIRLLENPNPNSEFAYNQSHRDLLYAIFQKDVQGTFTYYENDTARKIDYVCESIVRETTGKRPFIISLLCPEPKFRDLNDTVASMANWIAGFEFIHEFLEEGEEIGYRSAEKSINIVNDRAAGNIGMEIIVEARGPASNVTITRIESNEHISVGSSNKPFSMIAGDKLIITTGTNNKHVKRIRNGVTTEVNQYLTEDSEFIQIEYGDNNIVYSADTGEDNLIIAIHYSFEYEGA